MEALQAIDQRRSTRKYKNEPVPRELLEKLLLAGQKAPTARNLQELHFYVISERERMEEIGKSTAPKILSSYPHLAERQKELNVSNPITYGATAGILITIPRDGEKYSWGPFDAGCACENICVAAEALGLGTVPVGLALHNEEFILKNVGADVETEKIAILIPIGYIDPEFRAKFVGKKELKSQVTWL